MNLKKNIPWILHVCFPKDMKLWNNTDIQSRLSKGYVQLLFSSSPLPFLVVPIETPCLDLWPLLMFHMSILLLPFQ